MIELAKMTVNIIAVFLILYGGFWAVDKIWPKKKPEKDPDFKYTAVKIDERGRTAREVCQARDLEHCVLTAKDVHLDPGESVTVRTIEKPFEFFYTRWA